MNGKLVSAPKYEALGSAQNSSGTLVCDGWLCMIALSERCKNPYKFREQRSEFDRQMHMKWNDNESVYWLLAGKQQISVSAQIRSIICSILDADWKQSYAMRLGRK